MCHPRSGRDEARPRRVLHSAEVEPVSAVSALLEYAFEAPAETLAMLFEDGPDGLLKG